MTEIWKQIPRFSRYEASNLGNIRSINYKNSGNKKILKPSFYNGYAQTMLLNDDGKYKSILVHRIIAITFIGDSLLEINHIDGVKDNNKIENLEYVSHSENQLHAYKLLLQKPKIGESNGNSKLTEQQVIEIREYVSNFNGRYYGRKALAEKYNVSESYIKEIVNSSRKNRKNAWSHIKNNSNNG